MDRWVVGTDMEKTLFECHFATAYLTWTGLGSIPSFRVWEAYD
jgi:hypothetical protein